MNPDLKLAIWDVDGTLIDSREVIQRAMNRAFVRAGLGEIDYQRTRTIVGLELGEAIARLAPLDYRPDQVAQLSTYYKQAFVEQRSEPGFEEPLYKGARETIERLCDEGWLLGVATGKARRGLDIVFDHHGLHRYFVTLKTVDGGPGKPHPRMIEDALNETGARAGQAVMIGDTRFDMEMARNAGVHAMGVSWGFHTEAEIRDGGAHELHHEFDTLNAALDACVRKMEEGAL